MRFPSGSGGYGWHGQPLRASGTGFRGEMRLYGAGILFEHVEEQIDRFILLIAQQEVHPAT